jgi:diadenylate cyclase
VLQKLLDAIQPALLQIRMDPKDYVDILILSFVVYQLLKLTKETRASQVLKGFGVIIVAAQICAWLDLSGVAWMLNYIVSAGAIALVILFQPELRRALERLGAGRLLDNTAIRPGMEEADAARVADEIARAVQNMAKKRTGALIVLQRGNTLSNIVESGIGIDARLSFQLIENIFVPNTPLHDGAMIVHYDRIVAAGCFLPLAANAQLASDLGTRHRAAVGMSETTDALVIVVSEETGIISIAEGGKLTRYLDAQTLRKALGQIYGRKETVAGRMLNMNLTTLIRRRKRDDETRP